MKTKLETSLLIAAALTGGASSVHARPPVEGRIYRFESDGNGFNTNTFFYDNGTEVVAFDAQFTPELARQSIAFLRTKTSTPLRYLVVTHPNPDKFNGMEVFREAGAQLVASRATVDAIPGAHAYKKYFFVNIAKMFTEATYPQPTQFDVIFEDTLDLPLSQGDTVHLQELHRPGISSNQTIAWIPSVSSLVVGDLVHPQVHAWLEGGIVNGKPTPTLASWSQILRDLRASYGSVANAQILGGRGQAAALVPAIDEQLRYLAKADQMVTDYVKALGAKASELQGDQANAHFAALQKEFEQAFPSYGLGYMIQYGVYGLAQSKL